MAPCIEILLIQKQVLVELKGMTENIQELKDSIQELKDSMNTFEVKDTSYGVGITTGIIHMPTCLYNFL